MSSPGVKYIILLCLAAVLCMPAFALTADPMDLSVGARSMGMGKAYVAVAEDAETVFINPAGLGTISTLKLGSMYTNMFDDVQYAVLSCAYPLDNESGTLGAGIIRQGTENIWLYNIYGTREATDGKYGSNMLFVSHGFDLGRKFSPWTKVLYGGYTVKYIMKGGEGFGTEGLAGSGFAVDLGLLYKPQGAVSYGLNLQNILSTTMTYQNGFSESIGSAAKIGAKIGLMGDSLDGSSFFQSDSKLDMAIDCDTPITGQLPASLHVGLEYKPSFGINYIDKILTLRTGINQVPTPKGPLNNVTVGLGINYQGVEFNYAFTPSYGDIPETSTHFFSISFIGVPKPVQPVEEMKSLISELMPEDKILTRDNALLIQGKLNDPKNILKVEINDAGVAVSDAGAFEMNVPVSTTGKHLITVRATDLKGRTEERSVRVVRLVKFADVAENHWAVSPVEKLATAGLVEGYPNGTFQPERALSRAELSTLLVKSKGVEPAAVTGKVFKDVSAKHWANKYIKGALDMGLVTGYPDKTFRPNNKITRTEGVVVLSRFGMLSTEARLETAPYPDLTAKYWASPLISAARTAGMLDYIGENDFEPKRELTRAEAVEILSKTTFGRAKMESLLDWTAGFAPETMKPGTAAVPTAPVSPIAKGASASKPAPGKGAAVVSVKEFSDINEEFWASDAIKYIATAGIMNGYPDGTFKPDRIVTRAELSSLLVKAKNASLPRVAASGYSDVSGQNWAAPYIKVAVESGYMTGRKTGKFEPNRGATRAETVAALVTFDNMELPTSLRTGPFPDMTARDWSSKYVSSAKEAGMLDYLKGQDFEANKSITRAEVAELLAKTKFGQAKIEQVKQAAYE